MVLQLLFWWEADVIAILNDVAISVPPNEPH